MIWEELFKIARGEKTVHDAACNIAHNIPETFDDVDIETRRWFMLSTLIHSHYKMLFNCET